MDYQLRNLILIYSSVAIFLIIAVIYRYIINSDISFLTNKVIFSCDYWCTSHLIMYIFLGFFAPKFWYVSLTLSLFWEYFEYLIERISTYIRSNNEDLLTNAIGLIIGIGINKTYRLFY